MGKLDVALINARILWRFSYFIYIAVYSITDVHFYLGDNCIVFEKFTISIGDLMVAN
jgi:hypothetical protein